MIFFKKKQRNKELVLEVENSPIEQNINEIKEINQQNNLTGYLNLSNALTDFSLVHSQLISYLATLKVQEITNQSTELTAMSQEMVATTEQVSSSMEYMNTMMKEMSHIADESLVNINGLSGLGDQTKESLNEMLNDIKELTSQISNVDGINKNVADIADQTNLLALNAAIEAARAGDSGRGFTVVADEVRKLSNQTKESVANVQAISNEMDKRSKATQEGIHKMTESFGQYLTQSNSVSQMIASGAEQIQGSSHVVENTNSAMANQLSIAESLSKASEDLTNTSKFISSLLETEGNQLHRVVKPTVTIREDNSIKTVLANRLLDHANFLRKVMAEAGQGQAVTGYKECAFGVWYEKSKEQYQHIQAFKEIDEPHKKVHDYAKELAKEESSENVQKLIEASSEILSSFINLALSIPDNESVASR